MENKDQPIVPIFIEKGAVHPDQYLGLTKREYFAGLAMQGLLATTDNMGLTRNGISAIAEESVLMADELLNQLSK